MMTNRDIDFVSREIAAHLLALGKAGLLARIDFEMVRAAVGGFSFGSGYSGAPPSPENITAIENLALRKLVEAVG